MSDERGSNVGGAGDQYYASGSYQQGAVSTQNDQAYAQSLQQQEFRSAQQQQQQPLPTVTGRPMQPAPGTQYVAMYPPSTAFDPAHLGVTAPHEMRLLEAHSLGRTVRMFALLDGLVLLLNCAWSPVLFLLIFWAPLSGWMAGTRYSTAWTYAYCCYYILRISVDLGYAIMGYLWFVLMLVVHVLVARYIFRFAKILDTLTPAEIEQLRNPSAVWSGHLGTQTQQQPFQVL